jgi:hypothetical protein
MTENRSALRVLLDEARKLGTALPLDLVTDIYKVEELVQFDDERRDAAARVRLLIQTALDRESLGGEADGNAP